MNRKATFLAVVLVVGIATATAQEGEGIESRECRKSAQVTDDWAILMTEMIPTLEREGQSTMRLIRAIPQTRRRPQREIDEFLAARGAALPIERRHLTFTIQLVDYLRDECLRTLSDDAP